MADGTSPLSLDSLLGPAPSSAPTQSTAPSQPARPLTIDDLLGPEHPPQEPGFFEKLGNALPTLSPTVFSGPIMDSYFSDTANPSGVPGRILKAFGAGASDGWGAGNFKLPEQTEKWMKDAGLYDDVQKQHADMAKSFGEAFLRNGAAQMAQGAFIDRYVQATIEGLNQFGETYSPQGMESHLQQLYADSGAQDRGESFDKWKASDPKALEFMVSNPLFGFAPGEGLMRSPLPKGMFAPEAAVPRVEPIPPVVARARELGVIGPEGEEPPPDIAADIEKRRAEESKAEPTTPGEAPAPTEDQLPKPDEAPPAPAPDLETTARKINPQVFAQDDALAKREQTFRRWINELRDTRDQGIRDQYDPQIAEQQQNLEGATGKRAATYRSRIADLTEQRDKALQDAQQAGDTLAMAKVRQDLLASTHKRFDLATDISAAKEQAAAQLGVSGPREALGAPAAEPEAAPAVAPEAPVAENVSAPPPESIPAEPPPVAPEQAAEAQVPAPQQEAAATPEPAPASAPSPEGGIRVVPGGIADTVAQDLIKKGRPEEVSRAQAEVVQALYESRAAAFEGRKGTPEQLYAERQPEVVVSPKPYLRVPGRKGKIFGEHDDFEEEGKRIITLYQQANASTFMHEMGHDTLTWLMHDADDPLAPEQLKQDAQAVRDWIGVEEGEGINAKQEERFANGFERYLLEGKAPSMALENVFAKFKAWLTDIYQRLRPYPNAISDEMRGVFDRLLTKPTERATIAPEEDAFGLPDLGSRHEEIAATTPPESAGNVADRLQQEADDFARQNVPEIADELGIGPGRPGERPATTGGEAPSGAPDRGGDAGQLEPAGAGGGEAVGTLGEGGGETAAPRTQPRIKPAEPVTDAHADISTVGDVEHVDKAGNFRQETLNVPDDIWDAIKQSVERNNEFMDFRRGVVTDKDALLAADAMGLTPAQVEKYGIGRAYTKEEIIAINNLMKQTATAVKAAAAKAADSHEGGRFGFVTDQLGNPTPTEAEIEYAEMRSRQRMILDTILSRQSGAFAEAGRSLQAIGALKKMAGYAEANQVADILARDTGRTLYQLRREIAAINNLDTPAQVARTIEKMSKPGMGAWALEIYRNNLIFGLWTHLIYNGGNLLHSMYEALGVAPMRGLVSNIHERFTGPTGDASFAHEGLSQLYGLYQGKYDGLVAAWDSFKAGQTVKVPHEELDYMNQEELKRYNALVMQGIEGKPPLSHEEALKKMGIEVRPTTPFTPTKAIPGVIGTIVRIPGERGIAPQHSFWRTVKYSQAKAAEAYRTARNEGLDPASDEFTTRLASLRGNPTEQIMQTSRDFANEGALMGKAGKFTQAVTNLVNYEIQFPQPIGPTRPLSFAAPFIHVIGNLDRIALIKNGPFGLFSPEIQSNLRGLNGVRAQDDAISRLAVGASVVLGAGTLAMNKVLPPSHPTADNPNEKRFWQMVNGYEHGINVGGYSYDISRLGTVGMQMSVAADLWHFSAMVGRGEFADAANYFMHSMFHTLSDGGIFRSFSDLFKATNDESSFHDYYINNFLVNLTTPGGSMTHQLAARIDPYERQATGFVNTWKRGIPGWSESLMPRRDIWGQPIPNASFRGVYAQQLQTDPTTMGLFSLGEKTGWFPGQPSRNMGGVKLNDEEYDELSEKAGATARQLLEPQITSPAWAGMPDKMKLDAAKQAFDFARANARMAVQIDHPRILEEQNKKAELALGKGDDAALQQ